MEIEEVEKVLQGSWNKETASSLVLWSENNPSAGQCAVSALVLQDYMGGEIVAADVELRNGRTVSHYFNVINGEEVDLTRDQFPEGTVVPRGTEKKKEFSSTREFMLSSADTVRRYALLKEKVNEKLNEGLNSRHF